MYLEEPVLSVLLPANKIYENALAPQAKIKKKTITNLPKNVQNVPH